MFPATVDSADFVTAHCYGTEFILDVFVFIVELEFGAEFILDVPVCVLVLKFTMSGLKMASSSSWMSLPLAVMALSWVLLPLGAIDLADFFVTQGSGVEFIWDVFAFVSDLKFITGELKMPSTSLTSVAQRYGAEFLDVPAFVFDLKFITGELKMAPSGMCIALAGC